jgi:protein-tyrosine phosphatase
MAWWAVLLLLPYLLLTWASWHMQRLLSREPCCNEVAPGLWIGRRVFAKELPSEVSLIVDLTVEFAEPRGVRAGRSYVCLPILDALVPAERPLRELVERIAAWPGTVYIHCALGHGRSALVAAAVLLKRQLAADAQRAEALIRQVRPTVRLTPSQRRLLERIAVEH